MKNNFDISEYIKKNYAEAMPITFEDAGVEIKKSSQVRIKTQKPVQYYEISGSDISSEGKLSMDESNLKDKANLGSLENQKLMVGDVLLTIRIKFKQVKIVTKEVLSHDLSVVASKGLLVLRSGDIEKAEFLKFYLERDEIKALINNHKNAKLPNGRPSIGPDVIKDVLLPDTINGDLSLFIGNSSKIENVVDRGKSFVDTLQYLYDKNREKFCREGIENPSTFDIEKWEKFGIGLEELIEAGKIGGK